jgi:DNA-binding GntR family transcriptional regulator
VRAIVLKGLKQIAAALARGDGDAAAAAMHENLLQARKAFIRASRLDKETA